MPKTILIIAISLSLLLFVALNLHRPIRIEGDGVFYYSWLHSAWFDHNLDFRNQLEHFAAYDRYSSIYTARKILTPAGLTPNTYGFGSAIMWLPFFLLAHLATIVGNYLGLIPFLPDGYSYYYHYFIDLSGLVFGLLAAYCCYLSIRRYFSQKSSLWAVAGITLATPWFYYQFFEPFMSHMASLFLVSLFWLLSLKLWHKEKINRYLLGLVIFLIIATRWQNLLFCLVLVPLWWRALQEKDFTALKADLVTAIAPILAIAITQALVWKAIFGRYLLIPQGRNFIGAQFHGLITLFSTDRGLLLWSPVLLLALAGGYSLWRKSRYLFTAAVLVMSAQWLLNSSLADLGGGEAFGARKFIETLPWLTLGLAALLEHSTAKKAIRLAIVALIIWNLLLIQNYRLGRLPRAGSFNPSQIRLKII